MRPRRLTRAQTITLGMAGATALLAILALLAPGWREQRHLKRVNAEIARLEPTVKEVERVARELDRKRKLITTVDALESTGIRPLPVLRDLVFHRMRIVPWLRKEMVRTLAGLKTGALVHRDPRRLAGLQ